MKDYVVLFSSAHKTAQSDRDLLQAERVEWAPDLVIFYDDKGEIIARYNRAHVLGVRELPPSKKP